MKEVAVTHIKILMGKREVELTVEEAKKLKAALEEIFGQKVVEKTEHIHHYDYWPKWYKYYDSPVKYDFGEVYCSDRSKNTIRGSSDNTLCLSIK